MAAGLLCIRLSPIYAFEAEEIAELRGGRAGVALAAAKNLSVPTDETSLLPPPLPLPHGLGFWVSFYLCERIGFDSAH